MLTRAGLGNQPGFAETPGEQRLTEHIVDLVGTGVVQIFALEEDARVTRVLREARNLGDDRRSSRVGGVKCGELGRERRVGLRCTVGGFEFVEGFDEGFGNETPAVLAEVRAHLVAESAHAPRNLWSVAMGSPVTSASPTSTTSAPASR